MLRSVNNALAYCVRSIKSQKQEMRLPSFSHFGLQNQIANYLQLKDIHTPTYIQYFLMTKLNASVKSNPLTHYHIVSPTGSGKTLAYLLPIVNQLKKQEAIAGARLTRTQRPRALIMTSNKQLVLQARNVAKQISHLAKIKCEALGIGRTLLEEKQIIQNGVDVLITGFPRFKRMLDHRLAFLSNLSWIVIDQIDTLYESQKLLVEQIFSTIITPKLEKPDCPRIIFSSTTNPTLLKDYLVKKVGNIEQLIDKKAHINLQNIKHQFLYCSSYDKHGPLLEQIRRDKQMKIIIFCNTVKSLHELEYFLNQQSIPTTSLHSQLSKQARIRNYEYFRDIQKGILLSTQLGARGLHFPKLNKVINYDFPSSTCDYLQRAGRTGRAGEKGTVVSLYFKKHLPIINQLKGASFTTPLKISNSAYGLKNREQSKKPSKFNK